MNHKIAFLACSILAPLATLVHLHAVPPQKSGRRTPPKRFAPKHLPHRHLLGPPDGAAAHKAIGRFDAVQPHRQGAALDERNRYYFGPPDGAEEDKQARDAIKAAARARCNEKCNELFEKEVSILNKRTAEEVAQQAKGKGYTAKAYNDQLNAAYEQTLKGPAYKKIAARKDKCIRQCRGHHRKAWH